MDIIDYLKKSSDCSFKEKEFNECDALILSVVSYFPFHELENPKRSYNTKELYKRLSRYNRRRSALCPNIRTLAVGRFCACCCCTVGAIHLPPGQTDGSGLPEVLLVAFVVLVHSVRHVDAGYHHLTARHLACFVGSTLGYLPVTARLAVGTTVRHIAYRRDRTDFVFVDR